MAAIDVKAMSTQELVLELTKLGSVAETIGVVFTEGGGDADGLRMAASVVRNGADVLDELANRQEVL